MRAIRIKIHFALALLVAAVFVATLIYNNGGFSLAGKEEILFCGTPDGGPVYFTSAGTAGQALFSSNCASCHSISKDLTGPALEHFEERFPMEYFTLFLQKPKKAFNKSRYLRLLKKKYNDMDHLAFPHISKDEVNNLTEYIRQEGRR
jgi:cytochrome c1